MSSTCSQGSAVSASDSKEPECEPSRSARSSRSAAPSSKGIGLASQSSLTLPNSRQHASGDDADTLMLFAEDSPARIFREPVTALGSLARDLLYGTSLQDSLASYDPTTQSWRTSQRCLIETWEPFLETWPASGMTRNGRLLPLAPLVLHTCDNECSLWPTPTASMDGRGFGIPRHERTGRYKKSTVKRVHALVGEHGWRIHPNFTEALMGFPTGWTEIAPSETPSRQRSRKR